VRLLSERLPSPLTEEVIAGDSAYWPGQQS
jgi:hypothetical protein